MTGPIPLPLPGAPVPPIQPAPAPPPTRQGIVARAADAWIAKLIDVSRNNNLLYYRPLKLNTVEFEAPPEDALRALIAGERTPVARLLPSLPLETAVDERILLLHPDLVPEDKIGVVRRLREIQRRAIENYEERGLETMYLAYGMATWTAPDAGRDPEAPVLLVPVTAEGKEARIALVRTGDTEINLVLLHVLEETFGCKFVPNGLAMELEDADPHSLLQTIEALFHELHTAASVVPGFRIDRRAVVGNFSFQKLAMVRDLQGLDDQLASNDIVAAMAGDVSARTALADSDQGSVDLATLDRESPETEFLVLDADSSQRRVVAEVVAGRSGVISGPPGTGKSQTIANLVAEMVANGKRVLFVAEKRAALDVVKRRLSSLGLGHLILDLHGGVKKRAIMAEFADTLDRIRSSTGVDVGAVHRDYAARRDALNAHVERLHRPELPSGLSAFQLQGLVLRRYCDTEAETRWRGDTLKMLTAERIDRVCDLLLDAGGLEELLLGDTTSPWKGAKIDALETAQAAVEAVQALAKELLPAFTRHVETVCSEAGLKPPDSFEEASTLCDVVATVGDLGTEYNRDIYALPLEKLALAITPGTKGGVAGWFARHRRGCRRAYRAALRCRRSKAPLAVVHGDLITARSAVEFWTQRGLPGGSPNASATVDALRADLDEAHGLLAHLERTWSGGRLMTMPLSNLRALTDALALDILTPSRLFLLSQLTSEIQSLGASAILEEISRQRVPADKWTAVLRKAWWASCLDAARLANPALATFDGNVQNRIVEEFQSVDRQRIELSVQRVRNAHATLAIAAMNSDPDGTSLVRREAAKRTRHVPLRTLIARAGDVVTAVKPCWMASPLAVSQLLDNGRQYFDLVIFDEASQVLPEDAVTSIVRGKATVVAGDRNQLPPTPFFVAGSGVDEDAVEEAEGTEGFESILDVLEGTFQPWSLQWHYRSRDERLIAFSNLHLYNNSLITFPGIGRAAPIHHILVEEQRGDAGTRSNGAEVERVVDLIVEHARTRPDHSLGVIAMGLVHSRRIEATLDERRRTDQQLDTFLDRDGIDRFFIKNLERVQGDERDCVILSIGYGKDSSGRLLYRFGPLLSRGGERRLNVAITRARCDLTVVSSFSHIDVDPERSRSRGVELLRQYLEYAASSGMQLGDLGPSEVEVDPFEKDVQMALEARGLQLIPQYGFSSYRIDLVAKHPTHPGALVLAIECDGATYHSAPMARDRDRLRQQHLEALGWTFCRIWSTDWFLRRDSEIERVLAAYRRAVDRFDAGGSGQAPRVSADAVGSDGAPIRPGRPVGSSTTAKQAREWKPQITRGMDISHYTPNQLASLVKWVQSDGLQRTNAEIAAEVRESLGLRSGSRIDAAIGVAIAGYSQALRARTIAPVVYVPPEPSLGASTRLPPSPISSAPPGQNSRRPAPVRWQAGEMSRWEAAPPPPPAIVVVPPTFRPPQRPDPPRFTIQQSVRNVISAPHLCASPGCRHFGPPGTCPIHDLA